MRLESLDFRQSNTANIFPAGPTPKSTPSLSRTVFQYHKHVTATLSSRLLVRTTSPLQQSLARLLPTQVTGSTHLGANLTSRNGAIPVVSRFPSHPPVTNSLLLSAATPVFPATTLLLHTPQFLHLQHLRPPVSPTLFTTLGLTPSSRFSWTRTVSRFPKVPRRTSLSLLPASILPSFLETTSALQLHPSVPPLLRLMVPPHPRLATSMLKLLKMLP